MLVETVVQWIIHISDFLVKLTYIYLWLAEM